MLAFAWHIIRFIWRIIQTGLLIYSVLSVMALIQMGLNFGIGKPLTALLDLYHTIASFIGMLLHPIVEPFVLSVARLLNIRLPYNPWWVHLFIPMSLYLLTIGLAIRVGHKREMAGIVLAVVGAIVAFVSSLAASAWPLDSVSPEPALLIGIGFVVFLFLCVTWHSLFIAPQGTRRRTFWRFALAYPLFNVIIVLFVVWGSGNLRAIGYSVPGAIQVLTMAFLMASRDICAGAYGATFERPPQVPWLKHFVNYTTTFQGARTLGVIVAAVLILALGRGV